MSPWEVLGLSRAEARDQGAVKRAYARLLKLHRPDRDPEGFRRIRDAYEMLTGPMAAWLADGGRDDDGDEDGQDEEDGADATATGPTPTAGLGQPADTVAVPATVAPSPATDVATSDGQSARPAPTDPLSGAIARLATAVTGGADDEACLVVAREVLSLTALDAAARARAWTVIGQHLASRPTALALLFDDRELLTALEAGADEPLEILLDHWLENRSWRRVVRLGEVTAERLAGGRSILAPLAARLGVHLAMREPAVAQRLLDLSFAQVPPAQRAKFHGIDRSLALGQDMAGWPAGVRHVFADALDDERMPDDPVLRDQVVGLVGGLPAGSPLRAATAERLPELTVKPARKDMRARRKAPANSDSSATSSSGCGPWVWVWVVIIVLINVGRSCSPSVAPAPAPLRPIDREQLLERIRESQQIEAQSGGVTTVDQAIAQMQSKQLTISARSRLIARYLGAQIPPFNHRSALYIDLLAAVIEGDSFKEVHRVNAAVHLGDQGPGAARALDRIWDRSLPPMVAQAVEGARRRVASQPVQPRPLTTPGPMRAEPVPITPRPVEPVTPVPAPPQAPTGTQP